MDDQMQNGRRFASELALLYALPGASVRALVSLRGVGEDGATSPLVRLCERSYRHGWWATRHNFMACTWCSKLWAQRSIALSTGNGTIRFVAPGLLSNFDLILMYERCNGTTRNVWKNIGNWLLQKKNNNENSFKLITNYVCKLCSQINQFHGNLIKFAVFVINSYFEFC